MRMPINDQFKQKMSTSYKVIALRVEKRTQELSPNVGRELSQFLEKTIKEFIKFFGTAGMKHANTWQYLRYAEYFSYILLQPTKSWAVQRDCSACQLKCYHYRLWRQLGVNGNKPVVKLIIQRDQREESLNSTTTGSASGTFIFVVAKLKGKL